MSYNQRGGIRMNRPSYGGGGYGGGGHQGGGYHSPSNQSYTQPAYSTPSNYGHNKSMNDSRPPYQPPMRHPPSQKPMQQSQPPHQQHHQQQQQQQQQPPPQPQQQPLQTQPAPAPTPVPPPTKIEPQSPMPSEPVPPVKMDEDKSNDAPMDTNEDSIGGGSSVGTPGLKGTPKFRPWNKRGAANVKITRKMRKRRQNARLRNLLAPKNAMMVLHELHPELKMVISETVNAANQTAYTVEIEVEGRLFRGHGMSKMSAKQAASENALKAVLLEKLEQNNLKINHIKTDSYEMETHSDADTNNIAADNTLSAEGIGSSQESCGDVPMKEEGGSDVPGSSEEPALGARPPQMRRLVEDDVPWGSLASFALFKLFSEWQSQGFQLPPSGLPPVFLKSTGNKKIPDDANKKHPVQLLNQIRPGSQYSESREGTPPNLTFKFTVVVDGQTFTGVGSNKKDAKKECAKHALESLGVKYD